MRIRCITYLAATLGLGCTRQATQVYVMASAPEGAFDAIAIEARDAETAAPCVSRDAAASSAVSLLGPLHRDPGAVSTLAIAPYDVRPMRITVWGKRGGVDVARRSFIVVPRLHESRSLCVPLHPGDGDCGCTDLSVASRVDESSRHSVETTCAAQTVHAEVPPEWGPRMSCESFIAASCGVGAISEPMCSHDAGSADVSTSNTNDGSMSDAAGDVR